ERRGERARGRLEEKSKGLRVKESKNIGVAF
ncbi:unnamed protein product, partial [marine sediment metagenome]